ncbi:DNA polymerase III subunit alpha [Desulfopila sp. IMCC35008]|uniref:DNA polymerase III subunit alpha n=1 Tax=Desulfopila sp. IMCC35008 TaxID=2653858 RepID=UPI0013D32643|nr:DNA polymerase III subunit alpha [Desulfopila sp. IMCC35008]
MSAAGFTHLHVHTQYSLLDGAIRLPDLLEKCKEYGMDSVAMTDHGAMFGALEFYTKAKKADIKPLVGCELYIAPKSRKDKKQIDGQIAYHIVLLAMNYTGYQNLMKMASIAQHEGFYYKPRIDKEVLRENNEGIIALTACLHGEIPYLIGQKNMDGARAKTQELLDIFGDRLYFEIQENGIPEQTPVNEGLIELSKEFGIKVVATNDCHYLNREEAHAHEVLLCIQTGKTINDPKRFRFSTDEFYFKSPDEMRKSFSYFPEAVANTQEIVDRCNLEIDLGQYYFPDFPVEEGETLDSMFIAACKEGLQKRFAKMREAGTLSPELEKQYEARLDMEIDVIITMGFPGYFLIVADFINWALDHDIPVGPGRGSGAGSLAAYCMAITHIDPIPHGLIFERFLNIERKSMPDFDIDFCMDRRGEVIDYVRGKYGGPRHVAQIVTYGTMKARGVIRDVGRALDIPFGEVDKIAKLVPDQLKMTIKKALQEEPKLQEAADYDPRIQELLTVSKTLEGLARHTGIHAAGVVVSPGPMTQFLPTCRGHNEETVTQYDMKHTEMTGLIKFDFLGLKTLTVIDKAVKHIKSDIGRDLDISTIPLDDQKTFKLLCDGDALGVFQLESSGMRELLVKMAPEQFSDLVALVALYRPGPLDSGMVDDFVETKHGRATANYPLPQIKSVLEETYGVIVYQEQVMKIANILASYSLGDADILRRAMGKKIPEVMDQEKVKFMKGALKNEVPEDKAEYIFDLMAKFAGYGFNKSHSAAYALVSYQTAYLKAHYPAQFMAALLSCDMTNTDKVVNYINECREHNIEVLPPDVNESFKDFTVIDDRVRFGLAAVKNVGESALDSIIEEREKNGKFTSLSNFCNRVDSRRVNSRVIEALIKSGSLDSFGYKRSQYMAVLDTAMEQAKAVQRDLQSGQMSLFSVAPQAEESSTELNETVMPDIPEWDERTRLAREKETVGFYITGHPLDDALVEIKTITDSDIHNLENWGNEQPVRIGGLIRNCKRLKSKRGDPMAFITVEDIMETVEVIVFPDTYSRCEQILDSPDPVIIQGTVQQDERGPKIIADSIDYLPEAREKYTEKVIIRLDADKVNRQQIEQVKKKLYQFHGSCPILLTLHFPGQGEVDIEVIRDLTIKPCRELSDQLEEALHYNPLIFKKKTITLTPRKKRWNNGGQKKN